jgi:hypothetical protein
VLLAAAAPRGAAPMIKAIDQASVHRICTGQVLPSRGWVCH